MFSKIICAATLAGVSAFQDHASWPIQAEADILDSDYAYVDEEDYGTLVADGGSLIDRSSSYQLRLKQPPFATVLMTILIIAGLFFVFPQIINLDAKRRKKREAANRDDTTNDLINDVYKAIE